MQLILGLIRNELSRIIDNMDSGNSNLTEEELSNLCALVSTLSNTESKLSKYQVTQKFKISRATFDNYVAKGIVCKGRRQQGFKEIFWYEKDLDKLREHLETEALQIKKRRTKQK